MSALDVFRRRCAEIWLKSSTTVTPFPRSNETPAENPVSTLPVSTLNDTFDYFAVDRTGRLIEPISVEPQNRKELSILHRHLVVSHASLSQYRHELPGFITNLNTLNEAISRLNHQRRINGKLAADMTKAVTSWAEQLGLRMAQFQVNTSPADEAAVDAPITVFPRVAGHRWGLMFAFSGMRSSLAQRKASVRPAYFMAAPTFTAAAS